MPLKFRVKIKGMHEAVLNVHIELHYFEEVVKQKSLYGNQEQSSRKHIRIPFVVSMSTETEKPSLYSEEALCF